MDTNATGAGGPLFSTTQIRYHRLIIRGGSVGTAIGIVLGLAAAVELYTHPRNPTIEAKDALVILFTPFLMAATGMLGGASWVGVFAPKEFLESLAGDYWMVGIGARTADAARIKSLVIAMVVTALFIFFPICVAIGKM